ncbi:hypothetical protein BDA99DRAFT_494568 [Phascolomyces articulosus]|uniref:Uncharacterized protein n=1 Tax=Phascolomyces articulosus TaxID=60185 RepID=A0AAD5KAQ3_9FUNG|nr:hypothetical protein BDA99DRAFT_494568 [Phascolomyces articulosus]
MLFFNPSIIFTGVIKVCFEAFACNALRDMNWLSLTTVVIMLTGTFLFHFSIKVQLQPIRPGDIIIKCPIVCAGSILGSTMVNIVGRRFKS